MTENLPRLTVVLIVSALLQPTGRAAVMLQLESYVELCPLIVKCRVERDERGLWYRVLESWKGTYSPDLFIYSPSDGRFRPKHWPVSNLADGQVIIFFFHHNPYGTMLREPSSFVVTNGKVEYGSSDIFGKVWYTVERFKRVVVCSSDTDARGAVFGAAAVVWLRASAQGEGKSELLERVQMSAQAGSLDEPPETAPADDADGLRLGVRNRSAVVVLVVAALILAFWLVYWTLNRVRMRRG